MTFSVKPGLSRGLVPSLTRGATVGRSASYVDDRLRVAPRGRVCEKTALHPLARARGSENVSGFRVSYRAATARKRRSRRWQRKALREQSEMGHSRRARPARRMLGPVHGPVDVPRKRFDRTVFSQTRKQGDKSIEPRPRESVAYRQSVGSGYGLGSFTARGGDAGRGSFFVPANSSAVCRIPSFANSSKKPHFP